MPERSDETEIARYYDSYWSPEGFNPSHQLRDPLLEVLARHLPSRGRVIDVGCGTAKAAPWLIHRGLEYQGVDVSGTAVERAQSAGFAAAVIDDASSLPFAAETYDAAICIEVLEHLFQPLNALVEIHRVLKPGGTLIVTTPNVAYWRRRTELGLFGRWNPFGDDRSMSEPWRDPHIRFFDPRTLRACLGRAGFVSLTIGAHEGAFLGDIPGARRVFGREPSRAYRLLMSKGPGLFGRRIYGIAHKPAE